jgi:hypothetical protein
VTRFGLTCCAAGLSACVAQPAPIAEPRAAFDNMAVSTRGRDFVVIFGAQTAGTMLTADGALPVAGASLQVTGVGLGRDEGIIAKEAARLGCEEDRGTFQPQAIGRYAAADTWVFDGACA